MPAPQTPTGIVVTIEARTSEANAAVEAALNIALNRIAIKWHAAARNASPVDLGRLRSSITFATPTVQQPARLLEGPNRQLEPAVVFNPPKPDGMAVIVGSNVEYAPAVHEGVDWPGGPVTVKEHQVKAHTRETKHGPVHVKAHTVRAHTRNMPPVQRAGKKFIETPGRELMPTFQQMVAEELAKI